MQKQSRHQCPRIDADTLTFACKSCLLHAGLDVLKATYHHRQYVPPDPLQFLYDYADVRDRELVAMICSGLAIGHVKQIVRNLNWILQRIPGGVREFIWSATTDDLLSLFAGFRHRYYNEHNLALSIYGIGGAIRRYGSLEECFQSCLNENEPTIAETLKRFLAELTADVEEDAQLLIPVAYGNSACKRMNLFLRWMVRCDNIDPGGWNVVGPDRLIIPLDTHMNWLGRKFHFTNRKSTDMQTAIEITEGFKKLTPEDPVQYDFSLTRLGISSNISTVKNRPKNLIR